MDDKSVIVSIAARGERVLLEPFTPCLSPLCLCNITACTELVFEEINLNQVGCASTHARTAQNCKHRIVLLYRIKRNVLQQLLCQLVFSEAAEPRSVDIGLIVYVCVCGGGGANFGGLRGGLHTRKGSFVTASLLHHGQP
jgi:hypothetical protein